MGSNPMVVSIRLGPGGELSPPPLGACYTLSPLGGFEKCDRVTELASYRATEL